MTSSDSLGELFGRLSSWARFPKYALERRLDIFLTPFLEPFLASILPKDMASGGVQLVAPEFPLRHREQDHLTINADYLLYLPGPNRWLLVELKTDSNSIDEKQLAHYRTIRNGGKRMKSMMGDLEAVRRRAKTEHQVKYARLLRLLRELPVPLGENDPLEAAFDFRYLSPPTDQLDKDELIELKHLVAWERPQAHAALFACASTLLQQVLADEGERLANRGIRRSKRVRRSPIDLERQKDLDFDALLTAEDARTR